MPDAIPRASADLAGAIEAFHTTMTTPDGRQASGLGDAALDGLNRHAAALRTALGTRDDAERAYRAAVAVAEAAHDDAEEAYRAARRQATNHGDMTPEIRAEAGLATPGSPSGPAALPTVADLAALPRPSGAVFLDWSGPTGGSLRYEVFAAPLGGDGAPTAWALVGSATATDFLHRDARPGARTAYRVEAVRGERRGEPSNEAAVHA